MKSVPHHARGIGRRIAALCGAMIALTVAIAVVGGLSMIGVRSAARAVLDHAMPYQNDLLLADRTLGDAQTACMSLLFLSPKSPRFGELESVRVATMEAVVAGVAKLAMRATSDAEKSAHSELTTRLTTLDTEHREIIEILKEDTADARRDAIDQTSGSCLVAFESVRSLLDRLKTESVAIADRSAEATDSSLARSERWLIGGAIVAMVMGIFLSLWFTRSIRGPLLETVGLLREMSSGDADLTRRLPTVRNDELGDLSRAFNAFVERQQSLVRQLIDQARAVANASQSMARIGERIESSAKRTAARTSEVAQGTQQIRGSLEDTVAGSSRVAENMNRVRESAENGVSRAQIAVDSVASAGSTMNRLTSASQEIGSVVKVISSFAEQTNLLALNATIEAARAGELGKGFAVVATEVKELAKGSSAATVDIGNRIKSIRDESEQAWIAINGVQSLIGELSAMVSSFATTACAQDDECRAIADSVSEIARNAEGISTNVHDLESIASEGAACAMEARTASSDLSSVSQRLSELVGRFRCD